MKLPPIAQVRKSIVFVLTLVATALTYGLVPAHYAAAATALVAVVGAAVHYQVPNEPPKAV